MAKSRAVDTSDIHELSADMRRLPVELSRHVYAATKRAAQNVKDAMVADYGRSTHFRQVARTVGYSITAQSMFGTGVIQAEVGPDPERGGGELRDPDARVDANAFDFTTSAAPLGHIAIYGGPRGGGGTVLPPERHLANEEPHYSRELDGLMDEVFR